MGRPKLIIPPDKEKYVNKQFNELFVIDIFYGEKNQKMALCLCSCGKHTETRVQRLGKNLTCGDPQHKKGKHIKHGFWGTKPYKVWDGMTQRCYNPNSKHYKNYGKRGIYICDEWLNDAEAFCQWYISQINEAKQEGKLTKNLEVDRINNDGPYAPWNCRLSTKAENNKNKRPKGRKK